MKSFRLGKSEPKEVAQIQCPNCNGYNTTVDSKTNRIVGGIFLVFFGIGFLFILPLGLLLILGGLIVPFTAIGHKDMVKCRNCKFSFDPPRN